MYRLTGSRRSYDWGSTSSMFDFLGTEPDGDPFAELWLGAHPTGPSSVSISGTVQGLDECISHDPATHLGDKVLSEFGRLPYLMKLLAPARPLSMQVHPRPEMARAGFADEELRGVQLGDACRNFKDEHHKPEMVFALTRFEGLVGFRDHLTALRLLGALGGPVGPAYDALASRPDSGGLQAALSELLTLTPADVDLVVQSCRREAPLTADADSRTAYGTVEELALFYPGDVGAVISLLLNRVVLEPGQLVFLGDGIPHAYLNGFGLELMANSDNVLRLGLTSKHVDSQAMFEAIDFGSSGYEIESVPADAVTHVFTPPVPEFALAVSQPAESTDQSVTLPGDGPRIVICVEGSVHVATPENPQGEKLTQGQSVFVPATAGAVTVTGTGSAAQAFVP